MNRKTAQQLRVTGKSSLYPLFNIRLPPYRTKKDYSTAIMDRKKAPHKLQVEDSKQDDNSVVEMTQAKMDELKIFRGDAVILKGKDKQILKKLSLWPGSLQSIYAENSA